MKYLKDFVIIIWTKMSVAFSAAAKWIVQLVCKVLIISSFHYEYLLGEEDFDNKNLIQFSPGFRIVLTTENKLFFPFKFALFLLFFLLRTIGKQKIRNKQFWKYASDYKRTWQNDNCILCSRSSLSEKNPIHLLFYPGCRCPPTRMVTEVLLKML